MADATYVKDNSEVISTTERGGTASSSGSYSVLHVDVEKCTGCRNCEIVCSLFHKGESNPSRARIYVVRTQKNGYITTIPVVCRQCTDALCMEMCPAQALQRDTRTHGVVVDVDRCLGCRTCVEVCPFGGASVDARTGKSDKCNLCDGDPTCVKFCSQGAISYVNAEEESSHRRRVVVGKYVEYLAAGSVVQE